MSQNLLKLFLKVRCMRTETLPFIAAQICNSYSFSMEVLVYTHTRQAITTLALVFPVASIQ